MKFKNEIARIYDTNPQNEWERMERHRTEFAVTLRAMTEHLPLPPQKGSGQTATRILDCGGGPGRYAIELAKRGYQVTLFDLSAENLALAKKKAIEAEVEIQNYHQGSATDLSRYADRSFDVVLLMGPLYHLLNEKDRQKAISESYRILKPDGMLLAAFITRFAPFKWAAANDPQWVIDHPMDAETIWETGQKPPTGRSDREFVAYFAHPTEVQPIIQTVGFESIQTLGIEGFVSETEEKVNALSGEAWKLWVDLNYKAANDPSVWGGVEHLLVVARKPKWRTVLRAIAERLNTAAIPYRVVGGTVAALYGVPVKVNDIDIEFDAENVYKAEAVLSEFVTDPVVYKESEIYRSHLGHLEIHGQSVEIFGQFERRQMDGWTATNTVTQNTVDLDGVPVQVPWLEESVLSYLRRKKLERASQCLRYCDQEKVTALLTGVQRTNVIAPKIH